MNPTPRHRPIIRSLLVGSGALFISFGCETAPVPAPLPPTPQATRTDSAGVEIVENLEPAWRADEIWRVDTLPDLRIGTVDDDPAYIFERISGAVTLSDGRIVVGDNGASTLRIYDDAGRWIEDAGGPGEGPSEFGSIRLLARTVGDSILVFDWSNQRYIVLDSKLELVRTVGIDVSQPGITLPHIKAFSASGRPFLIGAKPPWVDDPMRFYGQPGHWLTEVAPGEFEREVDLFPGQGNFWKTLYAAVGENLAVFPTGSFSIEVYDPEGGHLRSIRRSLPVSPIPDAFFDADPDEPVGTLLRSDGAITMTRGKREREHYPETQPFGDDLRVDRSGNLWVRHYRYHDPGGPFASSSGLATSGSEESSEPTEYSVFDETGQLLGEVRIPAGILILEIGTDWILGLTKDELDVEYVVRHRLVKPTGG